MAVGMGRLTGLETKTAEDAEDAGGLGAFLPRAALEPILEEVIFGVAEDSRELALGLTGMVGVPVDLFLFCSASSASSAVFSVFFTSR